MSLSSEQQQRRQAAAAAPVIQDEEEWEEWDGQSPFWIHCVAGSFAGVVEHASVYPLDTIRTHIQVCASCVHRGTLAEAIQKTKNSSSFGNSTSGNSMTSTGTCPKKLGASVLSRSPASAARGSVLHFSQLPTGMWQTLRFLMNESAAVAAASPVGLASAAQQRPSAVMAWNELIGMSRLWRGVETILIGCVPAHALYFSAYETVKAATSTSDGKVTAWGSSLAGAAAVCGHDMVLTPLDTIKQRMQLGYYETTPHAFREIVGREGYKALYRSFPITLASNIPYGMVMVTVNETAKQMLAMSHEERPTWQTVVVASSLGGLTASALTTPLDRIKTALQTQTLPPACLVNPAEPCTAARFSNWQQAARHILQTEGWQGFFRGMTPRVLSHTPAVAISWTTYEMTKQALLQHYNM